MGRKKIQISRIVDQRNRQVGDVSIGLHSVYSILNDKFKYSL